MITVDEALAAAGDSAEAAAAQLWHLDVNRLRAGKDYTLDLQERSRGRDHDAASVPLISYIDPKVWRRSTFATFGRLLDNYVAETGVMERVSHAERAEEIAFIQAVCATPIGRFLHAWLHANVESVDVSSDGEFCALLHGIWFRLYRRDASRDSSAFEHVFCGEIDDGQVKGLHNFVQVYREERHKRFDYSGYLAPRRRRSEGDVSPQPRHQVLSVRFEWMGYIKPASSMFIGTSPEFEVALYTLLFMANAYDALVDIGPYTVQVTVHQNRGTIGSAFPKLISIDEDELEEQWANEEAEAQRFEEELALKQQDEPVSEEEPKPAEEVENAESEVAEKPSTGFSYADALRG